MALLIYTAEDQQWKLEVREQRTPKFVVSISQEEAARLIGKHNLVKIEGRSSKTRKEYLI